MTADAPAPTWTRLPAPDADRRRAALVAAGVSHPDPFVLAMRVEAGALSDAVPHVSNVTYVAWLGETAAAHSAALGYTTSWYRNHDMMWFVARHDIAYHAECHAGDELWSMTWVEAMDRARCRRLHRLLRPSDERLVCSATSEWVLVQLSNRRPRRIPEEMAGAFTMKADDPCASQS